LRVIAGSAKGRQLLPVPGEGTRPITDRVKESLFDILGGDVEGARFLDPLSRGAAHVTFVDLNRLPVATVKANLKATGLEAGAQVWQGDAFAFLERTPAQAYDYVYIAPPQYKGLWKRALLAVDAHPELLSEDAWVMVQIHPVEMEPLEGGEVLRNLAEFDRRHYGSTLLIFYERLYN